MHCLLRGRDNAPRQDEWRPHDPEVTAGVDWVTVRYDSYATIASYAPVRLGPWTIVHARDSTWNVLLRPPALQNLAWRSVEADMGGLAFNERSERASSADEETVVWKDQLPGRIRLDVELPWQRSLALSLDRSFWSPAGIALWWVCASLVMAVAALRARRIRPSSAGSTTDDAGGENLTQTAVQWAVLSGAVALTVILLVTRQPLPLRWRTLVSISTGLALILVARPWYGGVAAAVPGTPSGDPAAPGDARRRQCRAVVAAASGVAGVGLLVVLAPELFGLPARLEAKTAPTTLGVVGLTLMDLATVWLWLTAMAAWAWRFAREGGLVRGSWSHRWDRAPVQWTTAVGILLMAVAGALFSCAWWTTEHQWQRVTWLVGERGLSTHRQYIHNVLGGFSLSALVWIFAYSWTLTAIALVALLHFRVKAQWAEINHRREMLFLGPEEPDLLLTVVIFAFVVGLRGYTFAGSNTLWGVWLLLNIGALYLVVAAGRKWSVLGELGERFWGRRLSTRRRRHEVLSKAHHYRNLNHQLYLLDQGRANDVTREELEDQLHAVRRWLVAGCGARGNPPDQISVLDVALAWGPEDHWWSNATHAARLAFCFGIPASAALVFLDMWGSWNWMKILYEPTRLPDLVAQFVLYQVAWAGAGFVLGALWRLLPGRRSPVRAWSLTVAYATPVCLAYLLIRITDADFGHLFLYVLLMLTVLTLTSIWMDTATFREEREFCPSRFALLLSIYQVRGLSGQVAWLITQVAATVGIWHQLAHG